MPALIAREHIGDLAFVCPGLPCPVAVLDDADHVHHPPARDPVVHDMAVRSQPVMRNNVNAEMPDALGRNQPAPGDAAGEARLLGTEDEFAHA